MPRYKLDFDPPASDFLLFGISCPLKDYRIVWALNKKLEIGLKRKDDIMEDEKKFALFSFQEKYQKINYHLMAVKNHGQVFLKELKNFDYIMLIEGNYHGLDQKNLLMQLRSTESVVAAYPLNPFLINSRQHLLLG